MRPSQQMAFEDHSPDDMNSRVHLARGRSGTSWSSSRVAILVVVTSVLALTLGLLLGRFAISRGGDDDEDTGDKEGVFLPGVPARLMEPDDPDVAQKIMDGIEPENIEEYLRYLSKEPHIAGRQRDFELVDYIKETFTSFGLQVQATPYDILLSYPSDDVPNTVRILDGDDNVIYDGKDDESDLSNNPGVVRPFHAYSPADCVEAPLVFAGYGRVEDYDWLRSQSIDVTGHIVIVKYGKMFRGDKVDIAHDNGAVGVIMYADPAEYTGMVDGDPRVYPETWWLPPDGVQRGTIFTGGGDPLTPGYPANNLAYRYSEENATLPKIPSHPVGYGAAEKIMRHLAGIEVPVDSDWRGGMNFTYRVGPGFIDTTWKMQLNVTSRNRRARAENVFGILPGEIEPDRYVLLGNHRDAWIYGALDPSTGTATMMEIARVMGELVKSGTWRPRRTIIFCSWGAEEYGLIGSTEWVEQYVATLRERAVAYINVDTAVIGNDTLHVDGAPLMHQVAYQAAKKVPNPNPSEVSAGRSTVYDTWLKVEPWIDSNNQSKGIPKIAALGSGSDFAPLLQVAGIPAVDLYYGYNPELYSVQWYALYHTEYEVFDIYKTQFDTGFQYISTVAKVSAEMARSLADTLVLPFSLDDYSRVVQDILQTLDTDYGDTLRDNLDNFVETRGRHATLSQSTIGGGSTSVTIPIKIAESLGYDQLGKVIDEFRRDIKDFETRLEKLDTKNPFIIRQVNDQMMLLERAFLEPAGLPLRPNKKHLLFAENANDAYAGSSFPGLVDLLFQIELDANPQGRWEKVKQHFSVVLHTVQSAGATLRQVNRFMAETPVCRSDTQTGQPVHG